MSPSGFDFFAPGAPEASAVVACTNDTCMNDTCMSDYRIHAGEVLHSTHWNEVSLGMSGTF